MEIHAQQRPLTAAKILPVDDNARCVPSGDSFNTPEKKERSECQHCGKIDSVEHILTQCEIPGQREVWGLAKELRTKRNPDWPWPGLGAIIGADLAIFKNYEGKIRPGDARLYRILVSESAHLIWRILCERVMQPRRIAAKW